MIRCLGGVKDALCRRQDRNQSTLFPERLDDYIGDDNPVRAIDVFVDELRLGDLGFDGVQPQATGRPSYHPATLLKLYVYGYLNRVQSSRRLVYAATGLRTVRPVR
jgi:transposase